MSGTPGQKEPYGRSNIANSKFASSRGIKGCRIFKLWGDPSRKLDEGERRNYRVQASRLASLKSIALFQLCTRCSVSKTRSENFTLASIFFSNLMLYKYNISFKTDLLFIIIIASKGIYIIL